MSFLRLVFVAGALTALAGCPQEPASKICPGTGILCPEDMYCGAVQPICLTTACGNGLVDPGEECDDGNVLGGDTCSTICRKESCGNNVLDPNEVCDDGNTAAGDGCSPNCMSKETCGNGIVDVGEVCDDGATDPGAKTNADGCAGESIMVNGEMSPAPCSSTEVCGNGIKDIQTGEVCDDNNTVSGDGCNSDCRSGEGCGNGIVDPGEQCDDGNSNNNDDCLNTCKTAKCGDGVVDNMGTRGEQCDPSTTGNPIETTTCNIDCTTRACGDGKVNQTAGEQCDSGVGQNGDTRNCTAACLLNICGDGKVDMQPPGLEQCDDGNTNNTDGCSNACQLASCGNATVDTGEQCDDGNMNDTDACVMCLNAVCGDGKVRMGVETCDDGNLANGDGCSSQCRPEGCGNGTLDPGEECDDGNAVNTDACVQGCRIALCGDGFVRMGVELCDDNNVLNGDGCSNLCRPEGCGNGQLDPGEACDDGNMNNGDGCSSVCTFQGCGDGIVNNGEACDGNGAGMGGETATCNVDCTLRSCGDAKVNATAGEQCDNGTLMGVNQNADNRDCTSMCKINICTDGLKNTLGPTRFEACDDGNQIPNDGCSNNCTLASCGDGVLDPGEQCDDQNVVNTDSCVNCMIATCGDTFTEMGVEECDTVPAMLPGGPYTCANTCKIQRCGNGIIDPTKGEQCDNDVSPVGMQPIAGDGCNQNCQIEFCGDGFVNDRGHEQCDGNGNGMGGETSNCNVNCTSPTCGDAIVNRSFIPPGGVVQEQCDPPNPANGCSALCRFERCGNSVVDPGEECDVGAADTSACYGSSHPTLGCLQKLCGNKRLDPPDGSVEKCDPPNGVDCDANCQIIPICGDGFLQAGETCDPKHSGSTTSTCDGDCTPRACGDGFVNTFAGEQCDPNTGTTGVAGTAMGPSATCNSDCTISVCGDTKVNAMAGEQCDPMGGLSNTGACLLTCKTATCGDGFTRAGVEGCDNGTNNNSVQVPAACPYNSSCMVCPVGCPLSGLTAGTGPNCGDATIQMSNGEQCDGANLNSMGCASFQDPALPPGQNFNAGVLTCNQCAFDLADCSRCGDSVIQGAETCDNGMNNGMQICTSNGMAPAYNTSCTACTGACTPTTIAAATRCGDGTINNAAEACDGLDFGAKTCATEVPSTPDGALRCTATCTISTAACTVNISCHDMTLNQGETDVDCGGNMNGCQRCANTKTCVNNGDCASGNCVNNMGVKTCQPAPPPPTCNDGIQNQGETAIDCGGTGNGCQRCANTVACTMGTDCASGFCNGSNVCAPVPAVCGNGAIETGEVCDYGPGKNNNTFCSSGSAPAYNTPCASCNSCTMVNVITGGVCGDNTKNGPEVCDGADVGGANCSMAPGGPYTMGTPGCNGTCNALTPGSCM
ncbi:MAG: DUF4215 domain-containing protein [Myxococcales bacterium]|nr:DUF4215 domain-containing protein [Myxococcales bacterium]